MNATIQGTEGTPPVRLACLGDSLTEGWRLRPDQAWPAVLERRFRSAVPPLEIFNHGVSGDTASGGNARLDRALEQRPHIMTVQFGANDSMMGVSAEKFENDLLLILERLDLAGVRPMVVPTLTLPFLPENIRLEYEAAYAKAASVFDAPLTPCILRDVTGRADRLLDDGFHPDAQGHLAMADMLEPLIAGEMLAISGSRSG